MKYKLMYKGKAYSLNRLAEEHDITSQTLSRRIFQLGMSVEEAVALGSGNNCNATRYNVYRNGELVQEDVVGSLGIARILGVSTRSVTKEIIENGVDGYTFESNCTRFPDKWNRVCRVLKESGKDLSKIKIVKENDNEEYI